MILIGVVSLPLLPALPVIEELMVILSGVIDGFDATDSVGFGFSLILSPERLSLNFKLLPPLLFAGVLGDTSED